MTGRSFATCQACRTLKILARYPRMINHSKNNSNNDSTYSNTSIMIIVLMK